jgi:hypothetical protein
MLGLIELPHSNQVQLVDVAQLNDLASGEETGA